MIFIGDTEYAFTYEQIIKYKNGKTETFDIKRYDFYFDVEVQLMNENTFIFDNRYSFVLMDTDFNLLINYSYDKEGICKNFNGKGALFDNYFIVGAESSYQRYHYHGDDWKTQTLGYLRKHHLVRNNSIFSFLE